MPNIGVCASYGTPVSALLAQVVPAALVRAKTVNEIRIVEADGVGTMFRKRYALALTPEMTDALEEERKRRFLRSVSETIRTILSEYLSTSRQATGGAYSNDTCT